MSEALAAPPGSRAPADRRRARWPATLAAGFDAGALGGAAFLAIALARRGGDFLDYWPAAGIGAALIVRSAGLYVLLFAAAGAALAGAAHPIPAMRDRRRALALVVGAMTAALVLVELTAWWQVEVLAGAPMGHPARPRAALFHGALAVLAGAAAAGLTLRARRRPGAEVPTRLAAVTLAGALGLLALGEAGLRLALHAGAPGVVAGGTGPERPGRVVVVGLDGMTLRVLSPLLRAGELPAFRRLMAEGAWGTLLTYGTAASPQVWTSMATGKRVRDHGIDDFVRAPGAAYRAVTLKSHDWQARPVWSVLSDLGRRVAVVNWIATYPPEEVDGYLVSRLGLTAPDGTHPPGLDAELDALATGERPDDFRGRLAWGVDRAFDVALHLLSKDRIDFLAVYDHSVDSAQHRFWKYYQPERFDPALWSLGAEGEAGLGTLVPDVYRHVDRRLGELLAQVGDDALVIVVSDHGQLAARRPRVSLRLGRLLEDLGYAGRAFPLVATQWTPTLRINLDLRGREPRGVVEPSEAGALAERLAADLAAVRFADGEPLFARVTVARDPASARGPGADLELLPSPRARRRGEGHLVVAGERVELERLQRVQEISGDHDHQGVIFVRGPGVEPGFIGQRAVPTAFHDLLWHLTDKIDAVDALLPPLRFSGLIERATTLDLTPTVLYAFGLPVGRDMAGRPLRELFAQKPPVAWVDTWEGTETPRPADDSETPSEEEILERLRALGYVD